ncbi:hypothetical protein K488DRAFT_41649 [Vararia minispora EC-137]|uniref:Uncharacterized protein n=1 Tax=Vararia minispora EC-137 TaxID=1314806 RepID=A0ACB8QY59_9AGAM|nr:hypothetical protein K488DRAFT_41649 [Vararia minispora EC-137]
MSTCAICLDALKSPTAFPCGHVFCYNCIAQSIHKLNPLSTTSCPTCRASFPLVSINAALVPPHLRPFFLAPFRRLYLDDPSPSAPSDPSSFKQAAQLASLRSENAALRQSSTAWRRRAEVHAATALGLAAFLRMARTQMREERDALRKREEDLQRREMVLNKYVCASRMFLAIC